MGAFTALSKYPLKLKLKPELKHCRDQSYQFSPPVWLNWYDWSNTLSSSLKSDGDPGKTAVAAASERADYEVELIRRPPSDKKTRGQQVVINPVTIMNHLLSSLSSSPPLLTLFWSLIIELDCQHGKT